MLMTVIQWVAYTSLNYMTGLIINPISKAFSLKNGLYLMLRTFFLGVCTALTGFISLIP